MWRCGEEDEDEEARGGNDKDPVPIYKRMDTRHVRESRRPKSSCGYMDASIFEKTIKIKEYVKMSRALCEVNVQ